MPRRRAYVPLGEAPGDPDPEEYSNYGFDWRDEPEPPLLALILLAIIGLLLEGWDWARAALGGGSR